MRRPSCAPKLGVKECHYVIISLKIQRVTAPLHDSPRNKQFSPLLLQGPLHSALHHPSISPVFVHLGGGDTLTMRARECAREYVESSSFFSFFSNVRSTRERNEAKHKLSFWNTIGQGNRPSLNRGQHPRSTGRFSWRLTRFYWMRVTSPRGMFRSMVLGGLAALLLPPSSYVPVVNTCPQTSCPLESPIRWKRSRI